MQNLNLRKITALKCFAILVIGTSAGHSYDNSCDPCQVPTPCQPCQESLPPPPCVTCDQSMICVPCPVPPPPIRPPPFYRPIPPPYFFIPPPPPPPPPPPCPQCPATCPPCNVQFPHYIGQIFLQPQPPVYYQVRNPIPGYGYGYPSSQMTPQLASPYQPQQQQQQYQYPQGPQQQYQYPQGQQQQYGRRRRRSLPSIPNSNYSLSSLPHLLEAFVEPKEATLSLGEKIFLNCSTNSEKTLDFRWMFRSNPMPIQREGAILSLGPVTKDHEGIYYCVAYDISEYAIASAYVRLYDENLKPNNQ